MAQQTDHRKLLVLHGPALEAEGTLQFLREHFNVVVTKTYRDGDEFKDSNSFSHSDLPVVSKAMDFAYGWIWKRQVADQKNPNGDA